MKRKICHLTTVHPRYDVRIFHKECKSLYKAGYDVNLIVADGKGDEIKDGIKIWDLGKPKNRLDRIIAIQKKAYKKVLDLGCELVHFHDPEILLSALKFKRKNIKVIFDSHEDISDLIMTRTYLRLSKFFRKILRYFLIKFEGYVVERIDGVVFTSDEHYGHLKNYKFNLLLLWNYPLVDELLFLQSFEEWKNRNPDAVYVGGVDLERGVIEMAEAVKDLDMHLHLIGPIRNKQVEEKLQKYKELDNIHFYGYLDRDGVRKLLTSSKFGLAIIHPLKNYIETIPVKLFEYLAAGLIVVGSNFPKYIEILEKNDIGYVIDPFDIEGIKKILSNLLNTPDEVLYDKVVRAQKLIQEKYNWEAQEDSLYEFYANVLG